MKKEVICFVLKFISKFLYVVRYVLVRLTFNEFECFDQKHCENRVPVQILSQAFASTSNIQNQTYAANLQESIHADSIFFYHFFRYIQDSSNVPPKNICGNRKKKLRNCGTIDLSTFGFAAFL